MFPKLDNVDYVTNDEENHFSHSSKKIQEKEPKMTALIEKDDIKSLNMISVTPQQTINSCKVDKNNKNSIIDLSLDIKI